MIVFVSGSSLKVSNVQDRDISLPRFNPDFAEFMGALAGDGHLTDSNNTYRVEFSLNATEDRYYADYLALKFNDLFGIEPRVYTRNEEANRVNVQVHSKKIHTYLSDFFPSGCKRDITAPEWIDSEEECSAFLRGIVDTDGSLFFAKRGTYERNSYPVIEIKLHDSGFLTQLGEFLRKLDISYHRNSDVKIQLNGKSRLKEWVSKIGFNNLNRISRYQVWKERGYCPPDTTLKERLEMVKSPG